MPSKKPSPTFWPSGVLIEPMSKLSPACPLTGWFGPLGPPLGRPVAMTRDGRTPGVLKRRAAKLLGRTPRT
jgi:hypothetical protein